MNHFGRIARFIRFILISLVGFTLLGLGIVMLVAPGPGILFTLLGLIILSLEYRWAVIARNRAKKRAADTICKVKETPKKSLYTKMCDFLRREDK